MQSKKYFNLHKVQSCEVIAILFINTIIKFLSVSGASNGINGNLMQCYVFPGRLRYTVSKNAILAVNATICKLNSAT